MNKAIITQEYNPFVDESPRTVVNVYVTNNNNINSSDNMCDCFGGFITGFCSHYLFPCCLLSFLFR